MAVSFGIHTFAPQNTEDPLAQLVEHNTFNVGVLGSSPKRITRRKVFSNEDLFFLLRVVTSKRGSFFIADKVSLFTVAREILMAFVRFLDATNYLCKKLNSKSGQML